MTTGNENIAGVPIHPSISQLAGFEPLLDLFHCWERARGNRMIPSKHDFERVMLDFPKMLPSLILVELTASSELQFLYVGNELVERRNQDLTHFNLEEAVAAKLRKFVLDWVAAIFNNPCLVLSTTRTYLPGDVAAASINLTALLSNEEGTPSCFANMSSYDANFSTGEVIDGYQIGSAGIEVIPIDIGLGVPDLPRTMD